MLSFDHVLLMIIYYSREEFIRMDLLMMIPFLTLSKVIKMLTTGAVMLGYFYVLASTIMC